MDSETDRTRATRPNPADIAARLVTGDRRALARAITLLERGAAVGQEIVRAVYSQTGRAHLIGVTGPPGVGKSTLISALAVRLRARGETVGVVAVDPSSAVTGGALLGDRVRMRALAGDSGIFVRSMAARRALGGLARATADVARLLDAAGFGRVLVETVGAGQGEIDVAHAVETVVLVEAPNLGDDIQANKAGTSEIADVFVVNKADLPGAARAADAIARAVALGADPSWTPPVIEVSATTGHGLDDLVDALERHHAFARDPERAYARRLARMKHEIMWRAVESILRRVAATDAESLATLAERAIRREIDPYEAADWLIREA